MLPKLPRRRLSRDGEQTPIAAILNCSKAAWPARYASGVTQPTVAAAVTVTSCADLLLLPAAEPLETLVTWSDLSTRAVMLVKTML
jgi:hypothetical protein